MRLHQLDVPALPILLPLGGALMLLSLILLRRRGRFTARHLATAWFASWYAVAVIGATLLPLRLTWGPGAGGIEWFRIIIIPLSTMRPDDFLLNIIMTLPLAVVLLLVFGVRDRPTVVRVGFTISLAIELTQLVILLAWHGQRWADTNDLISNTLGALLGYLALRRAMRLAPVRQVLGTFSLVRTEAAERQLVR
jgi:glycopeptide antibiotics resistance protein